MGSEQSSRTESNTGTDVEPMLDSARGRKTVVIESEAQAEDTFFVEEDNNAVVSDEETDESVMETDSEEEEMEDDTDDEEEDEEWEERLRILEDAKRLNKVAKFFLHPEAPVEVDGFAPARCYFERASAVVVDEEELEEGARILEEAKNLKRNAVSFAHPELPVVVDSTACARSYFVRASAPEQDEAEEAEERVRILAEAKQLKSLAQDYMHPERPVAVDTTLFGRNYFSRASAPEQEELTEERDLVMEDMAKLKKVAVDYLHPEREVVAKDPALFGRNFFSRASAEEQESDELDEERDAVLEEAAQLKKLAVDYLHPERPVVAEDPALFGRNYFGRASAEEQDEEEVDDERDLVLEDMAELKRLAVDHLHPERPVATEDPALFGRNYFTRASAEDQEDDDEERQRVLEEARLLKKLAVDFLHPERPVVAEDPSLFGRNYYGRASAEAQESVEYVEERARVMEEVQQARKFAVDFLHPERPVVAEDPTVFGRNFFGRPSSEATDAEGFDDERQRVLREAQQLREIACDFMHPERPIKAEDPSLYGRNYYGRASAEEQDSLEMSEERALVLQEAAGLKKSAEDFLHPERPVQAEDPTLYARNYFARASAPEWDDEEAAKERDLVLDEASQLKKAAMDFKHPELPVAASDPSATGRNYYDRPSARVHDQMVHTFPAHADDDMHGHEEHQHMDHFGMDEEGDHMFDDMREQFPSTNISKTNNKATTGSDGEEGNLSRSPSSVMLFPGEPAN